MYKGIKKIPAVSPPEKNVWPNLKNKSMLAFLSAKSKAFNGYGIYKVIHQSLILLLIELKIANASALLFNKSYASIGRSAQAFP